MKKSYSIILLMLFPILVMAQASGGQITRPVKKQQAKTSIQTFQKQSTRQKMSKHSSFSQQDLPYVIQNLINNMVRVEGGTFIMGAQGEQYGDRPAHQVTLSSFSIGKYEVTQEEWEIVMGNNPASCKGSKRPVERVSWNDCQEFIRKLNIMTGKHFRLPTEAEWEFAARGGNLSNGYKYAGGNNDGKVAWNKWNSGHSTHDVGQKIPNELGLYDMSGNVEEWCLDWKGDYSSNSLTNPTGPSSGTYHVSRGGSWCNSTNWNLVVVRGLGKPDKREDGCGFRLAL